MEWRNSENGLFETAEMWNPSQCVCCARFHYLLGIDRRVCYQVLKSSWNIFRKKKQQNNKQQTRKETERRERILQEMKQQIGKEIKKEIDSRAVSETLFVSSKQ